MSFLVENSVEIYSKTSPGQLVLRRHAMDPDAFSAQGQILIDFGRIARAVIAWREMFPKICLLQRAGASGDQVVLSFLSRIGVRLTVNTGRELKLTLQSNVDPADVVFTGICKLTSHIRTAASHGVRFLTFSSAWDLDRINAIHPAAAVCLRILNCQHGLFNVNPSVDAIFDTTLPLNDIFQRAKDLGVNIKGFQIDLEESDFGSSYIECFARIRRLLSIAKDWGMNVCFVNFGSGAFINNLLEPEFAFYAEMLNKFSDEYPDIEFHAEPNELVVGNSAQVCCSVMGLKKTGSDGVQEMFYYLNDGVYGSFSRFVYDPSGLQLVSYKKQKRLDDGTSYASTFWGPTCDSMDRICSVASHPTLAIGDIVVFDNMGCQSLSAATSFNGFSLPSPIYAFCAEELEAIREFPRFKFLSDV